MNLKFKVPGPKPCISSVVQSSELKIVQK